MQEKCYLSKMDKKKIESELSLSCGIFVAIFVFFFKRKVNGILHEYLTTFDCTKKCMQDLSIENVNLFCDSSIKKLFH